MRWNDFNDEEKAVIRLTGIVLSFGLVFKVLFMSCPESRGLDLLGTLGLALGAGSTASVVTTHITRTIREHKLQEHFGRYAGKWERVAAYQYSYLDVTGGKLVRQQAQKLKNVDGKLIVITHEKGRQAIGLVVEYDKERGVTECQIEFPSAKGLVGEGTYLYVSGACFEAKDNDGIPHSGKYTMHLFPNQPDVVRVYYNGLAPEPDAKGYEIWKRT